MNSEKTIYPEDIPFYPHPLAEHSVRDEDGEELDVELSAEQLDRFLFGVDANELPDVVAIEKVKKAIKGLSRRKKAVVTRYLKGESFEEIGKKLTRLKSKGSGKEKDFVGAKTAKKIYYEAVRIIKKTISNSRTLSLEEKKKRSIDAARNKNAVDQEEEREKNNEQLIYFFQNRLARRTYLYLERAKTRLSKYPQFERVASVQRFSQRLYEDVANKIVIELAPEEAGHLLDFFKEGVVTEAEENEEEVVNKTLKAAVEECKSRIDAWERDQLSNITKTL